MTGDKMKLLPTMRMFLVATDRVDLLLDRMDDHNGVASLIATMGVCANEVMVADIDCFDG